MGKKLQITVAAEVESLAIIRDFIDEACLEVGISDEITYDIKLAVDEACSNIIEHGYMDLEPGSIICSLQYGTQQMVVRLTDFGHPFEPSEPPAPDPKQVMESGNMGGFGLYFIYRSVDEVTYESSLGGNTLTLIKQLNLTEKSA